MYSFINKRHIINVIYIYGNLYLILELFVDLSGCVPIMMTMQDQVNKALVTQAYRLMAITCCNQLNLL